MMYNFADQLQTFAIRNSGVQPRCSVFSTFTDWDELRKVTRDTDKKCETVGQHEAFHMLGGALTNSFHFKSSYEARLFSDAMIAAGRRTTVV